MLPSSPALSRHKLCIDFGSLKHACPKGIYVAPVPEQPLLWTGVMFIRKGPYADAVLRFQIHFARFPHRPPVVAFQSDLFHPLVTPLTTYTYSTRDSAADTQSAVDEQRLPPGGLSLRHGFPEWFVQVPNVAVVPPQDRATDDHEPREGEAHQGPRDPEAHGMKSTYSQPPHVIELLQYMRIIFDTEEVLDTIPLDAAANPSAWHAWQSYRSKSNSRATSAVRHPGASERGEHSNTDRSMSPRQQPGGARRPGEWNWQGVWEDRVRRSVQNSLSEGVLFGGDSYDVINFVKMDADAYDQLSRLQQTQTVA